MCGKKLTIGVLHRVEELADREGMKPEKCAAVPFHDPFTVDYFRGLEDWCQQQGC